MAAAQLPYGNAWTEFVRGLLASKEVMSTGAGEVNEPVDTKEAHPAPPPGSHTLGVVPPAPMLAPMPAPMPTPMPAPVPAQVPMAQVVRPVVRPTGRRVVQPEDLAARVPQTPLYLQEYTPAPLLDSEIARLEKEMQVPFDRRAIDERVSEAGRIPQNIKNYLAQIERWKRRAVEIESLAPYDDFARSLHVQGTTSARVDRQLAAAATRAGNKAREAKSKEPRSPRDHGDSD